MDKGKNGEAKTLSVASGQDCKGVKKGDYRLVFFTPEMLLERRRWRNMLKGEVYTTRLQIAVDELKGEVYYPSTTVMTVKKWYDLYTCVLFYSLRFL